MATGFIMLDSPNTRTAQGTYPRRGGFRPSGTCIVHTSEGSWQAGVDSLTRLVQTRGDYGCYHQACDWVDIAHYYPWEWETWQDSETNNWAVGIAAACKTSDWAIMPEEIREGYYRNLARMAADFVTYMRETYGVVVPLRRISGAEARAGVPGFCAHGDSGVARSDPGRDFDWAKFFDYTRQVLNGTLEDDMPLTQEDYKQIALHVWAFSNPALDSRDMRQMVADVAAGNIAMTNQYGTTLTVGEQLGHIDKNVNDARDRLVELVEGLASRPVAEVEMGAEDVDSLAEQLKAALAPGLAAELAKRLAE